MIAEEKKERWRWWGVVGVCSLKGAGETTTTTVPTTELLVLLCARDATLNLLLLINLAPAKRERLSPPALAC